MTAASDQANFAAAFESLQSAHASLDEALALHAHTRRALLSAMCAVDIEREPERADDLAMLYARAADAAALVARCAATAEDCEGAFDRAVTADMDALIAEVGGA
jgi:hypothetical protein